MQASLFDLFVIETFDSETYVEFLWGIEDMHIISSYWYERYLKSVSDHIIKKAVTKIMFLSWSTQQTTLVYI